MIFYGIRHKISGQLMPQMVRGRGYSHWNPSAPKTLYSIEGKPTPRLLTSEKQANKVISGWFHCPNSRNDSDGDLMLGTMDGRRKEDLKIVKFIVSINK